MFTAEAQSLATSLIEELSDAMTETLFVRDYPSRLLDDKHGRLQLVWEEKGIRYAIETVGVARDDLLRIAASLVALKGKQGP